MQTKNCDLRRPNFRLHFFGGIFFVRAFWGEFRFRECLCVDVIRSSSSNLSAHDNEPDMAAASKSQADVQSGGEALPCRREGLRAFILVVIIIQVINGRLLVLLHLHPGRGRACLEPILQHPVPATCEKIPSERQDFSTAKFTYHIKLTFTSSFLLVETIDIPFLL